MCPQPPRSLEWGQDVSRMTRYGVGWICASVFNTSMGTRWIGGAGSMVSAVSISPGRTVMGIRLALLVGLSPGRSGPSAHDLRPPEPATEQRRDRRRHECPNHQGVEQQAQAD